VGLIGDSGGNFYICDTANHCIRKISAAGVVTTFVGKAGTSGTTDATGENARFNSPTAITADSGGTFYVTDSGNSTIRKITTDGVVTTFAGTAGSVGSTDGVGAAARFNSPKGIVLVVNAAGTAIELYVTDSLTTRFARSRPTARSRRWPAWRVRLAMRTASAVLRASIIPRAWRWITPAHSW